MSMDIEKAADFLAGIRLSRTPLEKLSAGSRPCTHEQGYAVESLLRNRLEEQGFGPRVGYKVGCTTPVMQEFLNIDQPCFAGIMANTIHRHPTELKLNDFQRVGVECEIAVRMAEDVTIALDGRVKTDEMIPFVESCMAAIEIVDNRYADFASTDTPTLIADGFFGAGCVLGEEVRHWRELDLEMASGRMLVNGEEVGTGIGSAVLGHPLNALSWLANHLAKSEQILMADDVVLLGSIVQTHWVEQPGTVVVEVEGLGRVEATFS
jgi:2-keto-4-pentenoate hydratase